MPDRRGVSDALSAKLQEHGVEVLRFESQPDTKTLSEKLKEWSAGSPVQGVYWLPALDDEGPLSGMDLVAWREALRIRVKSLYVTAKALYEQIGGAGEFLVSATSLGGQHGYDASGATCSPGRRRIWIHQDVQA